MSVSLLPSVIVVTATMRCIYIPCIVSSTCQSL